MLADLLWLVLGLALLVGGGEALVRGASALARRFGVSSLVIGLTIVAFGTSAPELAVNVAAALEGRAELSFGNIMGSNIANVGLILGLTALLRPLVMHREVILREIPMMSLAALATLVMALDRRLDDTASMIGRGDALLLLLFFSVFLYYTARDVLRQREDADVDPESLGTWASVLLTVGGLVGLTVGGDRTVLGASGVASAMGVSETVIGLTVVAVGTSLPELVTSLVGLRRGESDLAVGNIVGSNIFNLLFVLGITAGIRPIGIPAGGVGDLALVLVLSLALLPMSRGGRLPRWAGAMLLATYVGYLAWRSMA